MEIEITKNKEEFITLLQSTQREGVGEIIKDLDDMDFFKAPASAANHLCVEGGLVEHSLNTCKAALMIWKGMIDLKQIKEDEVKKESVIIASLLHDICKADIYQKSPRKHKNSVGDWVTGMGYKCSYNSFPMGHGEKSLVLALCSGLEMTDSEMLAIRWHMGPWAINMNSLSEQKNYEAAREMYPLVSIIHAADELAASLMERKTNFLYADD